MRTWLVGLAMLGAAACGAGKSSAGDGGGAHSCADLPNLYTAALAAARKCEAGGQEQCHVSVRLNLLCGCETYVNDPTVVNALYAEWQAQDCAATPLYQGTGCVAGCLQEVPRTCIAGDTAGLCQELQP